MHRAAAAGDLAALSVSIPAARDVDARAGTFGRTPLHEAAAHGHMGAATTLLAAGANPNSTNLPAHRWTPIHEAAAHANGDMVALLLRHGADPAAETAGGDTALDLAANNERSLAVLRPLFADSKVEAGLALLRALGVLPEHIADSHYTTGSGETQAGGETFHYSSGIVINTRSRRSDWAIVAYHGTSTAHPHAHDVGAR